MLCLGMKLYESVHLFDGDPDPTNWLGMIELVDMRRGSQILRLGLDFDPSIRLYRGELLARSFGSVLSDVRRLDGYARKGLSRRVRRDWALHVFEDEVRPETRLGLVLATTVPGREAVLRLNLAEHLKIEGDTGLAHKHPEVYAAVYPEED